jgi:hypothetical protein
MVALRQWRPLAALARRWAEWRRRRGRILAVKLGYNPNSSSLGVDVTFLLFGMAAIALLTPLVALFLRGRRARNLTPPAPAPGLPADGQSAPASRES